VSWPQQLTIGGDRQNRDHQTATRSSPAAGSAAWHDVPALHNSVVEAVASVSSMLRESRPQSEDGVDEWGCSIMADLANVS
jgi:hypothetical protein